MCDSFNSNSKMALHILKPHPLLEISRGRQQLMQKITVALGYTSIILLSRVTSFREFNTKKSLLRKFTCETIWVEKLFLRTNKKEKYNNYINIGVFFFNILKV